jgi:hypothetical protein
MKRVSKKSARKAKQGAEEARLLRRAGTWAFLAFGALMVIGVSGGLLIMRARGHRSDSAAESLIDLENARCPTCGDAACADFAVDWRHLRVRLAHSECERAFCAAPEKTLDSSGSDWRGAARTAREINHLSGRARDTALSKAETRWHVVSPAAGD